MSTPRRHLPIPGTVAPGSGTSVSPVVPGSGTNVPPPSPPPRVPPQYTPAPTPAEVREQREIVVSDTAEGFCIPILLGRYKTACRVVHFDLVSEMRLDIVALVGHGPLESIDSVTVDDEEVYSSTVGWCVTQVKLGTTSQTELANIAHAAWASAVPGLALVGLKINLAQAPLHGGLPRIEVRGRGLQIYDPAGGVSWSEDPARMVYECLTNGIWGAGIPTADVSTTLPTLNTPVDYTSLEAIGQTDSDSEVGDDYDRLQSFIMPHANVVISVRMKFSGVPAAYSFPCVLRTTRDGADIAPALAVAVSLGAGTYTMAAYFGEDWGGDALVPGDTYYLVLESTSDYLWRINTATDEYADGGAEYLDGTWQATNYDHWFQVAFAERLYRASHIISQRQPMQAAIAELLRVFHGRLAWYDGKWRIRWDWVGTSVGTLSDKDGGDIPILRGSLRVERRDSGMPNVCVVTYLDTQDWTEREVRYQATALAAGSEQPRELRVRALCVPSGGQAYRLAKTWLTRARRSWAATCRVPQDGIEAALCDKATLDTYLYAATKTVLINGITDGPDGTFDLSLLEFASGDFSTDAYIPEEPESTTGTRAGALIVFADEFSSGGVATGEVGEQLWTLSTSGSPAAVTYTTEADHPGIVVLSGGQPIGGTGSTTIQLDATQKKHARNSKWAAQWIARCNVTDSHADSVGTIRIATVLRVRWKQGNLDVSTNSGSTWTTLCTIAAATWVTIEASCDGYGTLYYSVAVSGGATYTGSVTVSGTTLVEFLYATVSASASLNRCILYVDRAELVIVSTR